jgi:hypothetical protein
MQVGGQPRHRVGVPVGPVQDEQRQGAIQGLVAVRQWRGVADVRSGALVGDVAGPRAVGDQETRSVGQPGGGPPAALGGLIRLARVTGLLVPEQVVAEEVVLAAVAPAHAAAPSALSRRRLLRALPRSLVRTAVSRSSSSATWPGTPAGSGRGPLAIRVIISAGAGSGPGS